MYRDNETGADSAHHSLIICSILLGSLANAFTSWRCSLSAHPSVARSTATKPTRVSLTLFLAFSVLYLVDVMVWHSIVPYGTGSILGSIPYHTPSSDLYHTILYIPSHRVCGRILDCWSRFSWDVASGFLNDETIVIYREADRPFCNRIHRKMTLVPKHDRSICSWHCRKSPQHPPLASQETPVSTSEQKFSRGEVFIVVSLLYRIR